MNVFVLGGDGFCGWPTALHLSHHGYNVIILDNLSRRKIDLELGVESLTPIASIQQRLHYWTEVSGKTIHYEPIDLSCEYQRLLQLIISYSPDAIVHFAEQRSAPYSMKGAKERCYTVNNNINVTHNVLSAIVDSERPIHLVHLGTMGVYGYAGDSGEVPEGYLDVKIQQGASTVSKTILHPMDPGSIYHTTKCMDQSLFYFYNKNFQLPITDLHQGIVWGNATEETAMHPGLVNRFDYDGEYGTVLNRFIVQSVVGHPLTVYGTGGQTRAFIHIQNTIECIRLAIENAPSTEKVAIYNQVAEVHQVLWLAEFMKNMTAGAKIKRYDNPRKEKVENNLAVDNHSLRDLGFKPIFLKEALCDEVLAMATKYKARCDLSKILSSAQW